MCASDEPTDQRIIISETRRGNGFAFKAFWCLHQADFIGRIREDALRRRSDGALDIETLEQAMEWNNEAYGVTTQVIDKASFDALTADSWDTCVLDQAEALEWYTTLQADEDNGMDSLASRL